MDFLCIKETCIYVNNLDRTRDFYSGKLGLPVISLVENRHVFFKAGASVLLCFIAEQTQKEEELPPHGASGNIHFALEISKDDYSPTLLHIKNSGIAILHEHVWKNGLRSFYFQDPDAHLVEIIEQGLWEQ